MLHKTNGKEIKLLRLVVLYAAKSYTEKREDPTKRGTKTGGKHIRAIESKEQTILFPRQTVVGKIMLKKKCN